MATKSKTPVKRPVPPAARAPVAAKAPEPAATVGEEPVAQEDSIAREEAVAALEAVIHDEPVEAAATVILAEREPFTATASASETLTWPLKTLELWNDNALAFVGFAEELGKAKSIEDALDLQSRFVNERLEAFMRETKTYFTVAWRFGPLGSQTLCS